MPKVFSLIVADASSGEGRILAAEHDLSSFNYFQRGSVQEFLAFFAKTAVERTQRGMRQKIEEQQMYVGHVYVRGDGLAGVIVTDVEYPTRSAFTIVNKILDEFSQKFPRSQFASMSPANTASVYPDLRAQLMQYQDPHAADPLLRVQRDLDETKIVLHKTMESLLNRGEVLEDLVNRSDQLSSQSKMFYKTAKSTNSCCTY
ncbi:palmitoyltransferase [Entophlyctis luteolus]|nr:palmitoyltransferase [Entophlyctis luteolus]KAJ3355741.1 palmitoyltransferase [Entophlyctis luteolus]KAJ3393719.1 palmitoyltransferase [Entophlyctis sp. JEL0112]